MRIPSEAHRDAELIFRGEYDQQLKEDPRTVLDIGANVGLFSKWASEKWPDAKIFAYEPTTDSADLFRSNLAGVANVHLAQVGVRGETGRFDMFSGNNRLERSFHYDFVGGDRLSVDCIDAATLPSTEFVKIDTEGSEWEILQRLDLSKTKAVSLETHTAADASRITSFMIERGFCVHGKHWSVGSCQVLKFARRDALIGGQRVMVAIPYYGGTPPAFTECLLRLVQQPPCNLVIRHCNGDSLVSRARNTLTAEFLDSDCTDLLFVDSDLIFSSDHVWRMISHDADVVGGFYPKKQDGELQWVCNALVKDDPGPDTRGLQPVRYMGTGFLRIKRHVFEQMIARWGDEIMYHPDHAEHRTEYDLWPVGVYKYPDGSRRYLSEDWYFCQRWLDLGGQVLADTRVILSHIGHAVYPLQSQRSQLFLPRTGVNASDTAAPAAVAVEAAL